MSRCSRCFVVVFGLIVSLPALASAASPNQVNEAIKRGIDYLFAQQKDGNWEHVQQRNKALNGTFLYDDGQWGMPTATATYGLLCAGVSPADEHIKKALAFLRSADIVSTYALCMRGQCWGMLPKTDENRKAIRRDTSLFMDGALTGRNNKGLFDTFCPPRNRNQLLLEGSAFGTIGVAALNDAGAEIPTAYWTAADHTWRAQQNTDGGWGYGGQGSPSVESGSGAGVTALFLTEKFLHQLATTNGNIHDTAREKGLQFISHVRLDEHTELHWMYLIQRIAAASALKRFGDMDWYQTMGDLLMKLQAKDGSWYDVINYQDQVGNRIVGTGYVLAMLSNGRAPLVMNKLRYDQPTKDNTREDGPWNERPRDAANISEWIGQQQERSVNWQIVDIKAPVSDLLEAPMVYIAGNKPLSFTDEQVNHLRDYLHAGGLIVGNADGSSKEFAKSFLKLGEKMFPAYEFRPLPADSVVLRQQQYPLDAKMVNALSLSNGVREMMVLIQNDFARNWQMNEVLNHRPDFPFLADLFDYASDKSRVRYKGDNFLINAQPSALISRHIALARIQYNGNWDPEPGGWNRLANILRNTQHTELTVQAMKPAALMPQQFPFAHLTATQEFKLSDSDRTEIKQYVSNGGTLLVDAAGGSDATALALSREMQSMFGSTGDVLQITESIYLQPIDLSHIAYRRTTTMVKRGTPRLHAIKVGNRNAVFFSPEDFSAGLVGQPVDGVAGYEPESAAGLITNLLMQK